MIRWLMLSLLLVGCASTSRSGIVQRSCGSSAQNIGDLKNFGLNPTPGRIAVFRIFASWCPYCKDDLMEIGKRFKSGQWTVEKVNVLLLAYKNRNEDKFSFDSFSRDFERFGIPRAAVQMVYIEKDFATMAKTVGHDGKPLFDGWKGVPFGIIFGKDGRMVFRGHFTNSPPVQDKHYELVTELAKESCG